MTLTSPIDAIEIDEYTDGEQIDDDLTIIDDEPAITLDRAPISLPDPVMPFIYLGIITLIAIIATAAVLAL